MDNVPQKVLLPRWIFVQSKDEKEMIRLVLEYMNNYPNYRFLKVCGSFAICEKLESLI